MKEVLGALGGPIRDARSERQLAAAARERTWSEARARVEHRPELVAWLGSLRGTGALSRAANGAGRSTSRDAGRAAEVLLHGAVSVALRLPAKGQLLAVLASECTGDPHALDLGAPLGALALRAAAAIAGWDEMPVSAPARRRLWSEVGVDCDPLSAQVLVLGLRPSGGSLLSRHLRECADAGEPRRITLRARRGHGARGQRHLGGAAPRAAPGGSHAGQPAVTYGSASAGDLVQVTAISGRCRRT